MTFWLDDLKAELERGAAAMVVQVASVRGSAPREPGARMIVTADRLFGTIGGGALEWEAITEARARLGRAASGAVERVTLGPALGQCCGGTVTVVYEPFAPADRAWVDRLAAAVAGPVPVYRTFELAGGRAAARAFSTADDVSGRPDWAHAAIGGLGPRGAAIHVAVEGDTVRIVERVAPETTPLWLFGAGHVGRAIVRALEPLPFSVSWIDARLDAFPEDVPPGVRTLALAMPELIVDEAPAGAFWLVMTHSHSLDFEICEAILRRGDAAYLGLIGSKTKRATLVARLRKAGLSDETIAGLTCPIGLAGISGKAPAVIAASVAADLLLRAGQRAARETRRIGEDR